MRVAGIDLFSNSFCTLYQSCRPLYLCSCNARCLRNATKECLVNLIYDDIIPSFWIVHVCVFAHVLGCAALFGGGKTLMNVVLESEDCEKKVPSIVSIHSQNLQILHQFQNVTSNQAFFWPCHMETTQVQITTIHGFQMSNINNARCSKQFSVVALVVGQLSRARYTIAVGNQRITESLDTYIAHCNE